MHTIAETRVTHFVVGDCYITPGARSALLRNKVNFVALLSRHVHSDWGDVDAEDAKANNEAVRHGGRLFSVYNLGGSDRVYIITEADRRVTTLLLPSEY